jgi:flagellar assembly protein FliH
MARSSWPERKVETLLYRIIKASDSVSESFAVFDFSEIEQGKSKGDGDSKGPEPKSPEEVQRDQLQELETLIQQRLMDTERRVQELEQEGYEKGYAQGLKDGTEFGRKSMQVAREQFEALLEQLRNLPRDAFRDYRKWFIASCLAISRRIVGRELQTQPQLLINLMKGILREAEESQGIAIYLHPKDMELLSHHSSLQKMLKDAAGAFTVRADPLMSRGGCRMDSSIQSIDASLETRFALIEKALQEERMEEGDDRADG